MATHDELPEQGHEQGQGQPEQPQSNTDIAPIMGDDLLFGAFVFNDDATDSEQQEA